MREQNPSPPMTNMLNGLTTSCLSSWGIKIGHLLRTICWLGEIASTLSSWGIKISHPLWTIRWLRDINSGQTSRLQRTCLTIQQNPTLQWFSASSFQSFQVSHKLDQRRARVRWSLALSLLKHTDCCKMFRRPEFFVLGKPSGPVIWKITKELSSGKFT